MPFVVQFGSFCKKIAVDLLTITNEDYGTLLDKRSQTVREATAKNIVKKFKHDEILNVIKHLSTICFDLKKAFFIRAGSGSFLAELIKAYVDKYDGRQLAHIFNSKGKDGLRDFKFSRQSTDVFKQLWQLASARETPDYVGYLPGNLSNKIWQPIIMSRTQRSSLGRVGGELQALAKDEELLMTILMSNIDDVRLAVDPDIKPPPRTVRHIPAVTDIFPLTELDVPRKRVPPLIRQNVFFSVVTGRPEDVRREMEPVNVGGLQHAN